MNNPALLPEQPLYGSFGRGQPLGRSWAAFNTFSLGGRLGTWRGSAGVWTSGDELYRELSLTTALAKRLGSRLDAGLCLAYHRVTIKDFDPIKADFLIGAALNAPLSDDISVGVWYGNQPWGRKRAFQSLTRQLFQLSVNAHIGENTSWTIAAEKTPPFTLRQLVEIRHLTKRGIQLQLGYRTGPGMPYLGVQLPLLRLLLSVRVNIHPIFGLSTAFGLAFQ
ncbi:MAG: hypothetical protein JSW54_00085 [Fidelibacterota bacterium]|nr:MAG: hypothetical protein JSW54_00085 [Candidatus Neomarinimicrobiota bacterium]